MVNFVPAVPYHFCLSLPAAFTELGQSLLADPCTNFHRTPTYIVGKPEVDPVAEFLNRWLPAWLAVRINRWKAVLLGALFYQYCVR